MLESKPNRRKVQNPKKGKGWCSCDRYYGSHRDKCPVCGTINGRLGRYKKQPPLITDFENTY